MTDEQIRLYTLARLAAPTDWRIRTSAEETSGGKILYNVVLSRGDELRWLAIHSDVLRYGKVPGRMIAIEIRRALEQRFLESVITCWNRKYPGKPGQEINSLT